MKNTLPVEEKGFPCGISCAAFPVGCCLPCQPQQGSERFPPAFHGAPFLPQPPSGKWRMSQFIAWKRLQAAIPRSSVPPCGAEAAGDVWEVLMMSMLWRTSH